MTREVTPFGLFAVSQNSVKKQSENAKISISINVETYIQEIFFLNIYIQEIETINL